MAYFEIQDQYLHATEGNPAHCVDIQYHTRQVSCILYCGSLLSADGYLRSTSESDREKRNHIPLSHHNLKHHSNLCRKFTSITSLSQSIKRLSYGLEGPEFKYMHGQDIFLLSRISTQILETSQPPVH
jgi:hypothetical protein